MINRRRFLVASVAAAFSPAFVDAQVRSTAKLPRVAYVWLFDYGPSAPFPGRIPLAHGGSRVGRGKDLHSGDRSAGGSPEKLAAIMDELVKSNVDVIVAMCTPEAVAAKKVTSTIPIVSRPWEIPWRPDW